MPCTAVNETEVLLPHALHTAPSMLSTLVLTALSMGTRFVLKHGWAPHGRGGRRGP